MKARIICWILWKWLWATMWVLGVLGKSSHCLNCLAISPVPRILRHFKESFQEKKMYQELAWWEAMDTGTPYLRVTYDSLGSTLYTRVLVDLSYESVQESCVLPKSQHSYYSHLVKQFREEKVWLIWFHMMHWSDKGYLNGGKLRFLIDIITDMSKLVNV